MKRDEALQASDEALRELVDQLRQGKSEQLVRYLDMLSLFHGYSFANLLLIARQKPEATMVAGFQRWRQLDRFVRKGEKGIAILAPLLGRPRSTSVAEESEPALARRDGFQGLPTESPAEPAAGRGRLVVYGFRVVHVFDVSQTEGAELPQFAAVQGDPGRKLGLLMQLICREGIELEFRPHLPGGALGLSSGGKIVAAAHLPPPQMFATLVHELAHEKLHRGDRRLKTTRLVRETEAEAVAYVVCRAVGLDCSTQASDYIQLYCGDDRVLLQSLEVVRSVASRILEQLASLARAEEETLKLA